jgi:hypothetical protein
VIAGYPLGAACFVAPPAGLEPATRCLEGKIAHVLRPADFANMLVRPSFVSIPVHRLCRSLASLWHGSGTTERTRLRVSSTCYPGLAGSPAPRESLMARNSGRASWSLGRSARSFALMMSSKPAA